MGYPDVEYRYALPEYRYRPPRTDAAPRTCRGATDRGGLVPAVTACARGIDTRLRHSFPSLLAAPPPVPVSYKLKTSGRGVVYEVGAIPL